MDQDITFYMVWNPNGRPPSFKHDSLKCAEDEAKRLARTVPGQEFFVLCAVSKAKVREPVEVTRLIPHEEAYPVYPF